MSSSLKTLIHDSGALDFSALSDSKYIAQYLPTLETMLAEAKDSFCALLETPKDEISFETIVDPFFRHGRDLETLYGFLHHLDSVCATDQTRSIIEQFQPKMTEYGNMISLSSQWYDVLKCIPTADLLPDQKRSLALLIRDMDMAGVGLPEDQKTRLEHINTKLAELSEKFSHNTVDSRKEFFFDFSSDESFGDMPESDRESAHNEALRRGKSGWTFSLAPPSYQAILVYCTDSSVREAFWKANVQVATEKKYNNRPLALKILQLRHEKAQILGCETYAEYILQERMAESPKHVLSVLSDFRESAEKHAKGELQDLQNFSKKEPLELWDLAFVSEQYRKKMFSLDAGKLKEYFRLDRVFQGMFDIAKTLFGIEFRPVSLPLYHESVVAYEMWENGEQKAYFLFDFFSRPQKRAGAWCNQLRMKGLNTLPIAVNVAHFAEGKYNPKALLTHDDVQTMFHEFGHGLHLLLSQQEGGYENITGFHTEWDFVELPSQLLENWTWEEDGLLLFAQHYETGDSLPRETVKALQKSRSFLKGMFVLRQNELGMLDFLLHSQPPPSSMEELESTCSHIANAHSILPKPPEYRIYAGFSHIFSGGYAAGYYSYLWAEILEADIFSRFEQEGILNSDTGKHYRKTILNAGARKSGAELFVDCMGRAPDSKALMRKLGFLPLEKDC